MNQLTPSKQYEQDTHLLKKLDQAEKSLALSERKFGDLARKFDRITAINESLENDLEKQRKSRLEELISLHDKFKMLESENVKNGEQVREKDHQILVLKQHLEEK